MQKELSLDPNSYSAGVRLRSASDDDSDKILRWRNDPWIVLLSSSRRPVDSEEHRVWFQRALVDPAHSINIVILRDAEIGLVRLHRTDCNQASISIYLLRDFCGRGYGTIAIALACEKAWNLWPISQINAFTQKTNAASERSFRKNGFLPVEPPEGPEATSLLQLRKLR